MELGEEVGLGGVGEPAELFQREGEVAEVLRREVVDVESGEGTCCGVAQAGVDPGSGGGVAQFRGRLRIEHLFDNLTAGV